MNRFVIALGMFDGIHIGHRELLHTAVSKAREHGCIPAVFTYENHPKELFWGSFAYLSTNAERKAVFQSLGMERIDMIPFTHAFSQLTPEAFIEMLLNRYEHQIETLVCGFDYRFGKKAAGTADTLLTLGKQYGFSVQVVDPVYYGNAPCSSSRVREAVQAGDMHAVREMLCRPYSLTGKVIHNKGIGRSFGFPTANLEYGKQILPADGVYATATAAAGKVYSSVTNIGTNPTVNGSIRTVETHLPGISVDLYNRSITVLFLKKIREEIRFDSINTLALQIQQDALESENIFEETQKSVYNIEIV